MICKLMMDERSDKGLLQLLQSEVWRIPAGNRDGLAPRFYCEDRLWLYYICSDNCPIGSPRSAGDGMALFDYAADTDRSFLQPWSAARDFFFALGSQQVWYAAMFIPQKPDTFGKPGTDVDEAPARDDPDFYGFCRKMRETGLVKPLLVLKNWIDGRSRNIVHLFTDAPRPSDVRLENILLDGYNNRQIVHDVCARMTAAVTATARYNVLAAAAERGGTDLRALRLADEPENFTLTPLSPYVRGAESAARAAGLNVSLIAYGSDDITTAKSFFDRKQQERADIERAVLRGNALEAKEDILYEYLYDNFRRYIYVPVTEGASFIGERDNACAAVLARWFAHPAVAKLFCAGMPTEREAFMRVLAAVSTLRGVIYTPYVNPSQHASLIEYIGRTIGVETAETAAARDRAYGDAREIFINIVELLRSNSLSDEVLWRTLTKVSKEFDVILKGVNRREDLKHVIEAYIASIKDHPKEL